MALNAIPKTEQANIDLGAIDQMDEADAVAAMVNSHLAAAEIVSSKAALISAAANKVTNTINRGGRVFYCGAGSSGLMALADALEIPGTFGIHKSQIRILLAEGLNTIESFEASAEDSAEEADAVFAKQAIRSDDCFLLLSASGSTPFVMEMAHAAKTAGAETIAITNNSESELGRICAIAIDLDTPPEVVAGSTRLGAATAQKIVLNSISTLVGARLGHVYKGHMVNLNAANSKLRKRAVRIVSAIAETSDEHAGELLDKTGGDVKTAILIGFGADDKQQAERLLFDAQGRLDRALEGIKGNETSTASGQRKLGVKK
ncbi:N-acetylmuramic acid 6-phosphate etherase [Agrobacterium sp. ES01]|uniref:N-acetylmuramic acid 6-phosphate etherase n=1 Tax=Agrobacterium sp. ES01 TaxID=3420714 RepID=UPI003D105C28